MTQQFFRALVAEFGDVKIDASGGFDNTLRVAFNVERDKLPWPNNAELAVWNLNAETRAKLTKAGSLVARVAAGYDGQTDQIFYGLLDTVEHIKEGPDWITRMSASDCGEKIKQAKVSKSFGKGVLVKDVVKEILKVLGLGEGNLAAFANDSDMLRPIGHGGALHGNAVEELTHFLRSASLEFSIQDGKLQFVKIGKGVPNSRGPLITPGTGLVGSARLVREKATDLTRRKDKKKKVNTVETIFGESVDMITTVEGKCLLNASLVPGVPFQVESATVNGNFVCVAVRHVGDIRDQDWYSEWKGIPVEES
jgi:hypothetical protein